jgi:hypothetical protein
MFSILKHYGIQNKTVIVVKTVYNNSKRSVLVEGKLTDLLEITTGVLHTLVLFIIVIDYIPKNTEKEYAETIGSHGFTTHLRESARQPKHLYLPKFCRRYFTT